MLVAGESFPRTLSERASTSKATFRSAGFQGHSAIPFRLCSECLGGPRRQRGLDDKRGGGVCLLIRKRSLSQSAALGRLGVSNASHTSTSR